MVGGQTGDNTQGIGRLGGHAGHEGPRQRNGSLLTDTQRGLYIYLSSNKGLQ